MNGSGAWVPLVLGAGWSVAVLGGLWGRCPRPVRPRPGPARATGRRSGPLGRLGAGLRRRAGRPPDPVADRAVGWAALASAALLVPAPPLAALPWLAAEARAAQPTARSALLVPAPPLAALPWLAAVVVPWRVRRRARSREAEAWRAAVPDAVDLFSLALAGGLAVPGALAVVAPRAPPPLGPALVRAELRFRHGEPLDAALAGLGPAAPEARPLLSVLVAAHCAGAPVAEPLARLADELRTARRRRAEARARQVPVRMLFPLVGCTLPAFVLVTVVPAVVAALSDLQV